MSYLGVYTITTKTTMFINKCRTVKVTDTEPYYIRAVPATKACILC